ncbi:zinc ribbon domain-containing protein [Actinomycetes bacterium KLBMP 9797]
MRKLTPSQQWALSDKPAHEALVSESDFIAAQNVSAKCRPVDGASRTYRLAGLLRCGTCGRSMESQSSHGNPAYRCRHGHTSAHTVAMRKDRNLYLRENVILGWILAQLPTLTSRDAGIREEIARLQENRNAANLIAFLRAHNVVVECRAMNISLEPGREMSIIVRSPANAPEMGEGIPRQRKQKRGIV